MLSVSQQDQDIIMTSRILEDEQLHFHVSVPHMSFCARRGERNSRRGVGAPQACKIQLLISGELI